MSSTSTFESATHDAAAPAPARPRPGTRSGYTQEFTVGDCTGILTANTHTDGTLREVFISAGKHGSTLAGLLDTVSTAVSVGLRYGVPLQQYTDHLLEIGFHPAGLTDDPDIARARSITDYVFQRLARDFLLANDDRARPEQVDRD